MGVDEKITEIEEEISKTPYNKATQHHIGKLKAKLARLKEESLKRSSSKGGYGFGVKKTGDATVVLVGFPSVGKSTLINKLTNAESPVAAYDFTTLDVVPGMMGYKGVSIQLLDLPGVITGASSGRGRGKEVLSIARIADLILIIIDVRQIERLNMVEKELYDIGIRIDCLPPKMRINRTPRGGVNLTSNVKLKLINQETVREILNIYGIHNADVTLNEDVNEDRFIDSVMGNRTYVPSLIVLNKTDLADAKQLTDAAARLKKDFIAISAEKDVGLDELREKIFKKLAFIRVYMKPHGGEPDYNEPMILRKGAKVGDACDKIHRSFRKTFKYARVWGSSAKYAGQRKGLDHALADGDVVSIIRKK